MSRVSQEVPLHGPSAGFYLRMWKLAFPEHVVDDELTQHHEALYASQIDDCERFVRGKLRQPRRRLDPAAITCHGEHWGQAVECRYAKDGGE